jgi:hypothetical protein
VQTSARTRSASTTSAWRTTPKAAQGARGEGQEGENLRRRREEEGSDGGEEIIADFLVPLKDGKKHDVSSAMKAMKDGADKMPADELLRLCVAVAIGRHCEPYSYKPVELLETAKLYKVDPAKVKKAIADEAKAAATKEAEATPAKKKGLGRGMPVVKEPKKGLAALGIESPGAKKLKAKK